MISHNHSLNTHDELARPPAMRVSFGVGAVNGVIVACPHSGRFYPPELLALSRLDQFSLRRSEDAYVDQLFSAAPDHGAALVVTDFARAFVDLNRSETELDGALIEGLSDLPASPRVEAGLGVIPRSVGDGIMIYQGRLSSEHVQARLNEVHRPWHANLASLMGEARTNSGEAFLLDCHSMPNSASGKPALDVVLGDRFGASCAPAYMSEAIAFLNGQGLRVGRNNPYAGGYATEVYGKPVRGHHALQIEINRSLYMIEGAFKLRAEFDAIKAIMTGLLARLCSLNANRCAG